MRGEPVLGVRRRGEEVQHGAAAAAGVNLAADRSGDDDRRLGPRLGRAVGRDSRLDLLAAEAIDVVRLEQVETADVLVGECPVGCQRSAARGSPGP